MHPNKIHAVEKHVAKKTQATKIKCFYILHSDMVEASTPLLAIQKLNIFNFDHGPIRLVLKPAEAD